MCAPSSEGTSKVRATQTMESVEKEADVSAELTALTAMTIPDLQRRYHSLFGRPAPTNHRVFLLRRVAWELQVRWAGGLSDRATERLAELADVINPLTEAVIAASRRGASKPAGTAMPHDRGASRACRRITRNRSIRRPQSGTVIQRIYQGRRISVHVREDDFEYDGRRYRSLSAIAKAVTGAHWNGWLFFGLTRQKRAG